MAEIVTGRIVDIIQKRIYPGRVAIADGRIAAIEEDAQARGPYLLPGFVDAHVHVESSMLVPRQFAAIARTHGTVGAVTDPHEIANVLGVPGVDYMIENGRNAATYFAVGAPSCVPATNAGLETSGAELSAADVAMLLARQEITHLSEVMNFPAVLAGDPSFVAKLLAAKQARKPVDGHAPGVRGEALQRYVAAGISTDHECQEYEEAQEKIMLGMSILIREGSAAAHLDALGSLIDQYPERVMFCSDDLHPDNLMRGHINRVVSRAVAGGASLFNVLRAACINPVRHYQLDLGLLRQGDRADLIAVEDLVHFHVKGTWLAGSAVFREGEECPAADGPVSMINNFAAVPISEADLRLPWVSPQLRCIRHLLGELFTGEEIVDARREGDAVVADPERGILKLAVVNRYRQAPVSLAFVTNFGLRHGALASSVAHDCHNIIAVGATDRDLARAINLLIAEKGGLAAACGGQESVLPLPIAGLMSPDEGHTVARQYEQLDALAKGYGAISPAPYMALAFLGLLVIPTLKLSDKGLFDARNFSFTSLYPEAARDLR